MSASQPQQQYQVPQVDEFGSSLKQVQGCQTIDEFVGMYDSGIVYDRLNRIRSALRESGKDVETWTKDWATSLYQGNDEGAKNLHRDRKICLELLYTLLNRWKGVKGPQTVTEENIVNDFGDKRIMGILSLCLPMDRACALYNLSVPGEARPGTHWVSEVHVARDPEWAQRMKNYDGFPTMNKRFLWLMEDEGLAGLNLGGNNFMRQYTTPMEAHASDQV